MWKQTVEKHSFCFSCRFRAKEISSYKHCCNVAVIFSGTRHTAQSAVKVNAKALCWLLGLFLSCFVLGVFFVAWQHTFPGWRTDAMRIWSSIGACWVSSVVSVAWFVSFSAHISFSMQGLLVRSDSAARWSVWLMPPLCRFYVWSVYITGAVSLELTARQSVTLTLKC